MSRLSALILCVATLASLSASLGAQGRPRVSQSDVREETNSARRDQCRAWRTDVDKAVDVEAYGRAMGRMTGCSESGPEMMARLWVQTLGAERTRVVLAFSQSLRDARLLHVALETLRGSSDQHQRLAALALLGTYNNPSLIVDGQDLVSLRRMGWAAPPLSSHTLTKEGSQRLPANIKRLTYDTVQRIATSDADSTVRNAAEFLLNGMRP